MSIWRPPASSAAPNQRGAPDGPYPDQGIPMSDTGLETRPLGRTGMAVTRLGYGAMSLDPGRLTPVTDGQADTILNAVLDAGINFMDTSPDYGPSEEFIGRFIRHRGDEFFIATKLGRPV